MEAGWQLAGGEDRGPPRNTMLHSYLFLKLFFFLFAWSVKLVSRLRGRGGLVDKL